MKVCGTVFCLLKIGDNGRQPTVIQRISFLVCKYMHNELQISPTLLTSPAFLNNRPSMCKIASKLFKCSLLELTYIFNRIILVSSRKMLDPYMFSGFCYNIKITAPKVQNRVKIAKKVIGVITNQYNFNVDWCNHFVLIDVNIIWYEWYYLIFIFIVCCLQELWHIIFFKIL